MSRSVGRVVAASVVGAAFVSSLAGIAVGDPDRAGVARGVVAAGDEVTVLAVVPASVKTAVRGNRVVRKVVRPTRLERFNGSGWEAAGTRTTDRTGKVAYAFAAPATNTRYRVVAPKHRVRLRLTSEGATWKKKVTLRAWIGPVRTITVTRMPTQSPTATPTQAPTQVQTTHTPTHEPTQTPTQEPTSRLSLLTPRSNGDEPFLWNVTMDDTGQSVAFTSDADDLVPDDDNGQMDVFVLDVRSGAIELVSRELDGTTPDQLSFFGDISPDGRYVAYASRAAGIVPGVPAGVQQIYLYDRVTGETELMSATPGGQPGDADSAMPSVSTGGTYVAFETDAVNLTIKFFDQVRHVVRHERSTGNNSMVSDPEDGVWAGDSGRPSLSGDGTRISFSSASDHLVPDDDNGRQDVFLYDFRTGVRKMISRRFDGSGGLRGSSDWPIISTDGRAVVWGSNARDVVPDDDNGSYDVFRFDVVRRSNALLTRGPDGRALDARSGALAVDADASHVLISSSWQRTEYGQAMYLWDTESQSLRTLGAKPDGSTYQVTGGALSADGDAVAFGTPDALLPDDVAAGDDLYLWTSGR